jgi:translocation and assembly module TamB
VKKVVWFLFSAGASVLLLFFVALAFVLGSERGLHSILHGLNTWSPMTVSVQGLEGRLLDGWRMEGLHIHVPEKVDIHWDTFQFRWQAARLLHKELHVQEISGQGLVVQVLQSRTEGRPVRTEALVLPTLHLPFTVQVEKLHVQGIEIHRADQDKSIVITAIQGAARAQGDTLEVQRLYGDSPQYRVDLRGQVQAQGNWPLRLEGEWWLADPGINDLAGSIQAQGNLGEGLALSIHLKQPAEVLLHGQITNIFDAIHWQAQAATGHFHLEDIKVAAPVQGRLRILEAEGWAGGYRALLAAEVAYQDAPQVELRAKVAAKDYQGLHIEEFSVQQGESQIFAQADFNWAEGFSWQGALQTEALNPALWGGQQWEGRIKGRIHSQGRVSAEGLWVEAVLDQIEGQVQEQDFALQGRLLLDGSQLTVQGLERQSTLAQLSMEGQTDSRGRLDLGLKVAVPKLNAFVPEAGGAVQVEGRVSGPWQDLALDLALDGTELYWRKHSLEHLHATIKAELIPSGSQSGLQIHDLHLLLEEEAALHIQGQLAWAEGLRWQAKVAGKALDPSLLHPDFPGHISLLLNSQGSIQEEAERQIAVEVLELHGVLRGFPLVASGTAQVQGSVVELTAVDLRSGSSQVQVQGRLDWQEDLALHVKAAAADLAQLLPEAQGSFQMEGQVHGTILQPKLILQAEAANLGFQEYGLKHLTADIKTDLSMSGSMDTQIKATGMQLGEESIHSLFLQIQGQTEAHHLQLAVDAAQGQGRLTAQGGLWAQQWQGQLLELSLIHPQGGIWQMEGTADILLSPTQAILTACTLARDELRTVFSGSWQQEAGWEVQGGMKGLSLKSLREDWQLPLLPSLDGVIEAEFTASGKEALPLVAEFNLLLPDLALTAENYEDDDGSLTTWHWTNNQVQLLLKEDTVHINAQTKFQDSSSASLNAVISQCGDFTKPESMPFKGIMQVRIKDLGPLTVLTDYRVQAAGEFGGTLTFGGTVAAPRMDGTLHLKAFEKEGEVRPGSLYIPDLGITLEQFDLGLAGTSEANEVQILLGSGTGQLRAVGEVRRSATEPLLLDFTIQGQDFQALDLPEYKAVISPDLRLLFNAKGTALNGLLTVNKAHIAPTGFSGVVSSSKDIVVVDREGQEEKKTLPLALDLTLVLGQEVAVDTFGLKGWLDGRLRINAQPGQILTGTGSLSLRDSSFDFEGTSLKLTEGRIFYQGGPLDNPGLDIQATREVNKMALGVHLTGNANNMDIKLFSDVPMEDSEILSRLLTGQNMTSSGRGGEGTFSPAAAALGKLGGDALLRSMNPLASLNMEDAVDLSIGGGEDASDLSLVMGREIYKDLYISYGKALTGEGGSFKARYDLKYGFSIETETTSKTTGADLLWSMER